LNAEETKQEYYAEPSGVWEEGQELSLLFYKNRIASFLHGPVISRHLGPGKSRAACVACAHVEQHGVAHNATAGVPRKTVPMPQSKKHLKKTNFNMRIDPHLKAEFVAVAETEDVSAGQALRTFMRRYIARHRDRSKASANWDDGLDQLS
jgi:hypothetical protein